MILLITSACIYIFFLCYTSNYINGTVIAVKKVTEFEQTKEVKYKLNIENYDIASVQKEIKFSSKEEAEQESKVYETINEYEARGIGIEIKNKILKLEMPINYFEEEIGYNEKNNIKFQTQEGEKKEIIDILEVVDLLKEQGYTIK